MVLAGDTHIMIITDIMDITIMDGTTHGIIIRDTIIHIGMADIMMAIMAITVAITDMEADTIL